MSQTKRKWDILTDDERRTAIDKIITFFAEERDEEIGMIAAGQLLDFFLEHISPTTYNHALDDAKSWIKERLIMLDIDSEELKK